MQINSIKNPAEPGMKQLIEILFFLQKDLIQAGNNILCDIEC